MVVSTGMTQRLSAVIEFGKTVFHYAFVPTIIYLGYRQGPEPGMPDFSWVNLLW